LSLRNTRIPDAIHRGKEAEEFLAVKGHGIPRDRQSPDWPLSCLKSFSPSKVMTSPPMRPW
jgi:hypothetical protein